MNPRMALRQYQKVNAQAQTSEASPHRLVQMLMQGGLDRIAQAKGAMERKDFGQKGVMIGKTIEIIGGLRDGLDIEKYPQMVTQLDNLYEYMNHQLLKANLKNDAKILDEVARLLTTLKEGWDAIEDQVPAQ